MLKYIFLACVIQAIVNGQGPNDILNQLVHTHPHRDPRITNLNGIGDGAVSGQGTSLGGAVGAAGGPPAGAPAGAPLATGPETNAGAQPGAPLAVGPETEAGAGPGAPPAGAAFDARAELGTSAGAPAGAPLAGGGTERSIPGQGFVSSRDTAGGRLVTGGTAMGPGLIGGSDVRLGPAAGIAGPRMLPGPALTNSVMDPGLRVGGLSSSGLVSSGGLAGVRGSARPAVISTGGLPGAAPPHITTGTGPFYDEAGRLIVGPGRDIRPTLGGAGLAGRRNALVVGGTGRVLDAGVVRSDVRRIGVPLAPAPGTVIPPGFRPLDAGGLTPAGLSDRIIDPRGIGPILSPGLMGSSAPGVLRTGVPAGLIGPGTVDSMGRLYSPAGAPLVGGSPRLVDGASVRYMTPPVVGGAGMAGAAGGAMRGSLTPLDVRMGPVDGRLVGAGGGMGRVMSGGLNGLLPASALPAGVEMRSGNVSSMLSTGRLSVGGVAPTLGGPAMPHSISPGLDMRGSGIVAGRGAGLVDMRGGGLAGTRGGLIHDGRVVSLGHPGTATHLDPRLYPSTMHMPGSMMYPTRYPMLGPGFSGFPMYPGFSGGFPFPYYSYRMPYF